MGAGLQARGEMRDRLWLALNLVSLLSVAVLAGR